MCARLLFPLNEAMPLGLPGHVAAKPNEQQAELPSRQAHCAAALEMQHFAFKRQRFAIYAAGRTHGAHTCAPAALGPCLQLARHCTSFETPRLRQQQAVFYTFVTWVDTDGIEQWFSNNIATNCADPSRND